MSVTEQVLKVHERLYKATDGRVGHKMIGVPTLLLRTTGRKSGQTRTNALVYAKDGGDYIVVASNGGADKPPAWLFNLEAKPDVEVQIGRSRQSGTARALRPDDPDYDRLWKIVNDNNKDRYNGYKKMTDRPIPVVVLSPGGAPAAS
jgi:deazaflavin-dependent oxidoreductase (nitroreductase family)